MFETTLLAWLVQASRMEEGEVEGGRREGKAGVSQRRLPWPVEVEVSEAISEVLLARPRAPTEVRLHRRSADDSSPRALPRRDGWYCSPERHGHPRPPLALTLERTTKR